MLELPSPGTAAELITFLLPGINLPPDRGVVIYWAVPPFTTFSTLGVLHAGKPSAVFRTGWPTNPEVATQPVVQVRTPGQVSHWLFCPVGAADFHLSHPACPYADLSHRRSASLSRTPTPYGRCSSLARLLRPGGWASRSSSPATSSTSYRHSVHLLPAAATRSSSPAKRSQHGSPSLTHASDTTPTSCCVPNQPEAAADLRCTPAHRMLASPTGSRFKAGEGRLEAEKFGDQVGRLPGRAAFEAPALNLSDESQTSKPEEPEPIVAL